MSTGLWSLTGTRSIAQWFKIILWLFLFMTVISVFVPFSPEMPAPSLDPSWQFGMNQAVAQGLSFGTEIIFTYGPYAFINTTLYHPFTDALMLAGSLYLAISYWACFFLVMYRVPWPWILLNGICLAALMYVRDPLLFLYPLLAGLAIYTILYTQRSGLLSSKLAPFSVAILFSPLGLLPLIKGSLGVWCGVVAIICFLFLMAYPKRKLAILCLLSPAVAMLFFWMAAGQPAATLPSYVISMSHIISGYTEAMSLFDNTSEIIVYWIAFISVLIIIAVQKHISPAPKLFLLLMYSSFLFISFKSGFIRHDGHAIIASTAILFASLLLPAILSNNTFLPLLLITAVAWVHIDRHYIHTTPQSFGIHLLSTYSSAWNGIQKRLKSINWPRHEFHAAVNSLRQQATFPALPGTTDIYSYHQSLLIASGNTWSPRPILQSYSVYTPTLAEINRQHLLGERAPDHIIFRVEPIDGRMPSMEDGRSWPVLMMKYQPTRMENGFLFLEHTDHIKEVGEPLPLSTAKHTFGETVQLPQTHKPIMAYIEMNPTIVGRLASLLFKPSPLYITLELHNDTIKQYRIITGMVKSGFLLSPLIENTSEFGMLYGEHEKYLEGKRVKSMAITTHDVSIPLWTGVYTLTFSQMNTTTHTDISKVYEFNEFEPTLSGAKPAIAAKCEGHIDSVNDTSPALTPISGSRLLTISGWVAVSVDNALLPESVYVVLTGQQGQHHYLRTHQTSRPDVGTQFANPALAQSGFKTMADISALEGTYTIGLAMEVSGTIQLCPQFSIPITIAN